MSSERTRLSGAAVDLVTAFAPRLGHRFEPLVHFYVPTLLNLTTRTNKLYISRAQTCLTHIVIASRLPALIHLLREAVKDKSHTLRIAATELVVSFLEAWRDQGDEDALRRAKWVEDVESVIRSTAKDANATVRKTSRSIFELYKTIWSDRVDA